MEPSEWGYALPYGLQPPGGFYLRFPLISEERWILIHRQAALKLQFQSTQRWRAKACLLNVRASCPPPDACSPSLIRCGQPGIRERQAKMVFSCADILKLFGSGLLVLLQYLRIRGHVVSELLDNGLTPWQGHLSLTDRGSRSIQRLSAIHLDREGFPIPLGSPPLMFVKEAEEDSARMPAGEVTCGMSLRKAIDHASPNVKLLHDPVEI